MQSWRLPLLIAFAVLAGCADLLPSRAEADFAVVGATIVHPDRDEKQAKQTGATVVVARNRIVAVGPASSVRVPTGTKVVDGPYDEGLMRPMGWPSGPRTMA